MKNGSFENPPLGFETKETSLISAGTRSGMPEQHSKVRKQVFSKLKNPSKNYTFTFKDHGESDHAICQLTAWLAAFSTKTSTVIL